MASRYQLIGRNYKKINADRVSLTDVTPTGASTSGDWGTERVTFTDVSGKECVIVTSLDGYIQGLGVGGHTVFIEVSINGGSTWTAYGRNTYKNANTTSSTNRFPISCSGYDTVVPTGDVIVKATWSRDGSTGDNLLSTGRLGAMIIESGPEKEASAIHEAPSWKTFTPTWTTDGTAPTIGNGSISGRYLWLPETGVMHIAYKFIWGSTTNPGTNGWHFSLPTEVKCGSNGWALPGLTYDTSAVQTWSVTANIDVNAITTSILGADTNQSFVTGTNPFTWATGDYMNLSGTIEVGPR